MTPAQFVWHVIATGVGVALVGVIVWVTLAVVHLIDGRRIEQRRKFFETSPR